MGNPLDAYRKAASLGKVVAQQEQKESQQAVTVQLSAAVPAVSLTPELKTGVSAVTPKIYTDDVQQNSAAEPAANETAAVSVVELPFDDSKPGFVPAFQQFDPKPDPEEEKPLNPYLVNSVMTASPEKLTLMLYDGALKFMNETIKAIDKKDYAKAHKFNIRAQHIIAELLITLDQEFEVAKNMARLYNFILDRLVQGNVKKDAELVRQALGLTQEFRDTWSEAMKIAAGEKGALHPNENAVQSDIKTAVKMAVK